MLLGGAPLASVPIASLSGQAVDVSATLSAAGALSANPSLVLNLALTLAGKAILWETTSATLSGSSSVYARAEAFTDYHGSVTAASSMTVAGPKMTMLASARLSGGSSLSSSASAIRVAAARITAFSLGSGVLRNTMKVRATLKGTSTVHADADVFGLCSATLKAEATLRANAIRFTLGSPTIASGLMRPPSTYRQPMRLV